MFRSSKDQLRKLQNLRLMSTNKSQNMVPVQLQMNIAQQSMSSHIMDHVGTISELGKNDLDSIDDRENKGKLGGDRTFILGIDPGLRYTGWALIASVTKHDGAGLNHKSSVVNKKQWEYVISGVIKSNISKSKKKIKKAHYIEAIQDATCADSLSTDDAMSMSVRLGTIFNQLKDILSIYTPDYCAIENTYVNCNSSSSLKLAQARAAALLACHEKGLKVACYQAKTIKKTVNGHGSASKIELMQSLKLHLESYTQVMAPDKENMGGSLHYDDSDAIAIALCHAFHFKKF